MNNLTVNISTEILAKYDNYIVLAVYMDGKFSNTLTIDLNSL